MEWSRIRHGTKVSRGGPKLWICYFCYFPGFSRFKSCKSWLPNFLKFGRLQASDFIVPWLQLRSCQWKPLWSKRRFFQIVLDVIDVCFVFAFFDFNWPKKGTIQNINQRFPGEVGDCLDLIVAFKTLNHWPANLWWDLSNTLATNHLEVSNSSMDFYRFLLNFQRKIVGPLGLQNYHI